MTDRSRNRLAAAVVAVCAAGCFLPGIGRVALFDRDEPRFAEAARQMIVRGDYIVPYFNDAPRYHKPPFVYWVMAGGYKVFGVNELGARMGSAVAGVLACLLLFAIARDMFGLRVGLLAGVIGSTNFLTLMEARAATADAVQLLWLMTCFFGFWRVHQGDRRFHSYALLYGGIALGALTKGPVVPAVFLTAAVGVALLERRPALLRELHLVSGLLFAGAAFAAWMIPADRATGGEFSRVAIGRHVLGRAFSQSMEGHRGPFVYYLALLPLCFFPWFAWLPASLRWLWIEPDAKRGRAFLFAWAAAPFLLFSFLKTKLPHYILPAYPALAIATAYGLDAAMRDGRAVLDHWLGKLGAILLLLVGIAAIFGVALFPFFARMPEAQPGGLAAAALLAAVLACTLTDLRRRRNRCVAFDLAVGTPMLVLLTTLVVLPSVDSYCAARRLAKTLDSVAQPGDEIVSLRYGEPSLVFYAGRRVTFVKDWEEVAGRLAETPHLLCIARDDTLEKLPPELRAKLDEVAHTDAFYLAKGKWTGWTFFSAAPS